MNNWAFPSFLSTAEQQSIKNVSITFLRLTCLGTEHHGAVGIEQAPKRDIFQAAIFTSRSLRGTPTHTGACQRGVRLFQRIGSSTQKEVLGVKRVFQGYRQKTRFLLSSNMFYSRDELGKGGWRRAEERRDGTLQVATCAAFNVRASSVMGGRGGRGEVFSCGLQR